MKRGGLLLLCVSGLLTWTLHSGAQESQEDRRFISYNQLGYIPEYPKQAVVTGMGDTAFTVLNESGDAVFSGELTALAPWQPAGDRVSIADFSSLQTPGRYRLQVEGLPETALFATGNRVYDDLLKATIKAYYFNRASTALPEAHAGMYARPAGHPDTEVMIHESAASDTRPAGSLISSPKGWYDAGDFGKYVVNSGISTYTLLVAYEHFPDVLGQLDTNIPESGNAVPDILDEVKWNLDWLLTMQDPADGGVYHKLTTLRFADAIMPHEATALRYVVQKGTSATLNFAAVMAVASRVYSDFDEQFPGLAEQYRAAAEAAWEWAEAHPDVGYRQPADVATGTYGDRFFGDEFAWAAAELLILTGGDIWWERFAEQNVGMNVPDWMNTHALGYLSLSAAGKDILAEDDYLAVVEQVQAQADALVSMHRESAYGVAMVDSDFVWGSNGVVMNKAMVLLQALRLTGGPAYREAAVGLLDYILGKNPTGYSYVTGFGHKPPVDIHHRQSEGDTIEAPVPGFVAGGPQPGWQDTCEYPSRLPARSYLDHRCSYSTNEVTINWNAPLVYVLAALISDTRVPD